MNDFRLKNGVLVQDSISGMEIIIPDDVTVLGYGAFYNWTKLVSARLPEGLITIGDYAFSCCERLEFINIPETVTSIGSHAFTLCEKLKEISIPDGMTSIGEQAFAMCFSLEKIEIPDSVIELGENAFLACTNLNYIRYHHIGFSLNESFTWEQAVETAGQLENLLQNPKQEALLLWLKEHFDSLQLIDAGDFEKILQTGKIFDKNNIDDFIRLANEKNLYEIQLLLMNYKAEHIGYDDIQNKFQL
ncbi:MAG: leucine-rich repeat domain-containing protein [Oscillospiraceae bacterium]|nr:leucine-rich repeat domain-containing protein [Oscillospiraceae bacterium]